MSVDDHQTLWTQANRVGRDMAFRRYHGDPQKWRGKMFRDGVLPSKIEREFKKLADAARLQWEADGRPE